MKKVFCIGAHKTGTTSMHKALDILGYTFNEGELNYKFFFKSVDEIRTFLLAYPDINAYEDSPFNLFDHYKMIDETFPDALFILTVRESTSLFDSVINWNQFGKGCPSIYKQIYGYDFKLENRKALVNCYEERNQNIINYFSSRPNKLLVLNIFDKQEKSWAEICSFLNRPLPANTKSFPHANQNLLKPR